MSESIEQYIHTRASRLGLTHSDICRRAKISRQTLHSLVSGEGKLPSLQTVLSLAGALQVHPIRLLQLICDEHTHLWARPNGNRQRYRGDASAFVRDVNLPDGALVLPGQRFVKTWELQNVGQVPWEGRYLQCMDDETTVLSRRGETMQVAQRLRPVGGDRIPVPFTAPGDTVRVEIEFEAPSSPGTVISYWKSVFADGSLCFPKAQGIWVKVLVNRLAAANNDPN